MADAGTEQEFEVPEDLGAVRWQELQQLAKGLGLRLTGLKRPALEHAIQVRVGRAEDVGEESGPEGEPGEPAEPDAVAQLEDQLAAIQNKYGGSVTAPEEMRVENLPDLTKGEAPPVVETPPLPQQAAPQPPQPPAPVAQAPEPAPEAPVAQKPAEDNGYPEPPVLYYAGQGYTLTAVEGKQGRWVEGIWNEGIPSRRLTFDPVGRDPQTKQKLFAFTAREKWQIELIEKHDRRHKKLIWRGSEALDQRLASLRAQVEVLEALEQASDSVTIAERMRAATSGSIVTGARTTRNTAPIQGAGSFPGLDALLSDQSRMGAAARDAVRTAEAKGQI